MKTGSKNVKEKEEKENLKELFALWSRTSKNGLDYLSGLVSEDKENLIAYYNTSKKNPKEPDIRVYTSKDGQEQIEVASLWCQVSKKEIEYYTGKTNENESIIGFINTAANEENKQPYLRVYLRKE